MFEVQTDSAVQFRNNLYNKVSLLKKKWFYEQNSNLHSLNVLQLALRNFEIQDKNLTRELITIGNKKCEFELIFISEYCEIENEKFYVEKKRNLPLI